MCLDVSPESFPSPHEEAVPDEVIVRELAKHVGEDAPAVSTYDGARTG